MKSLPIPLLPILALLLAGCASTPPTLRPNAFPGPRKLPAHAAVYASLSPDDASRVEPMISSWLFARRNVQTGPIWARAFVGNETNSTTNATARLVIDSTALVEKSIGVAEKLFGPGISASYTYTASATLVYGTAIHALDASGTFATNKETDSYSALRQAIELCVADIAGQAARIIRTQSPYARVEIPFEPAPFAPYETAGGATLTGQAIGQLRGGLVELVPYVGYMKERDEAILANKDPGPRDSRLARHTRQSLLDSSGLYRFDGLPAGDYILLCRFQPRPSSPFQDDIEVARVISIADDENRHFVLTPY
jgi:hypothetical protein